MPAIDRETFTPDGLRAWHFNGFVTIAQLRRTDLADIPWSSGVYAVVRPDLSQPTFLPQSSGGRWKGKDPTVAKATLEAAWVEDAYVLYFGKAKSLRERVSLYLDFGAGKDVMHFGGRYLWHLDRTDLLQVAWVVTKAPNEGSDLARGLEQFFVRAFTQVYGVRPFANLQG